jgi:hypothetical protein
VRRVGELPDETPGVAADREIELRRQPVQSCVKLSSNRCRIRTSARSGRVRDTIITSGHVTAVISRLIGTGHRGWRNARRESGLMKQGTGPTSGQCSF